MESTNALKISIGLVLDEEEELFNMNQIINDIRFIDNRAGRLLDMIVALTGKIDITPEIEEFVDNYICPGDADYNILRKYVKDLYERKIR